MFSFNVKQKKKRRNIMPDEKTFMTQEDTKKLKKD